MSALARLSEPLLLLPPALIWLFGFFAFVLGAVLGSFLNVVIARLPLGVSLWRPRSHCMKCKRMLGVLDLVPILSWVWLKGCCRSCQSSISPRYPLVELIMGAFALAFALKWGFSLKALELLLLVGILTTIAYIDAITWLIPLSLPLSLAGLELGLALSLRDWALFQDRLFGALGGFLFLAALLVCSTWIFRRLGRLGQDELAMGWGDPVLLGALGASVGYLPLPLVVLLACLQGIAAYACLWAAGLGQPLPDPDASGDWLPPRHALPFGPFLALAGVEVALWQPPIRLMGEQFAIFLGL